MKTIYRIFYICVVTVVSPGIKEPANVAMPDSQRYPLKLCMIKYELEINFYNLEELLFSIVHLYCRKTIRNFENEKLLNREKKDNISLIIDQLKVLRLLLRIPHSHICMEGHLKLHLQSL